MKFIRMRLAYTVLLAGAMSGCGDGGSDGGTNGKWLDAPKALAMYVTNSDLISSGRNVEGCPVVIERIRSDLEKGASNFGTQQVLGVCSTAGMEFGNQVRCNGKRLQVNCI